MLDQNLTRDSKTSGNTPDVKSRLEGAWSDRWSSQIEAVIRKFPELRAELGLPLFGTTSTDVEAEWKSKSRSVQQALIDSDAVLLSSSLYRARGMMDQSSELISKASEVLMSAGLQGSFRLHFERGITAFSQGNYFTAIEDFFAASRLTNDSLYRLISLSNALFCLENLGIDFSKTLEEVEMLRESGKSTHPVYAANEISMKSFRMRQAFRMGLMSEALSPVQSKKVSESLDHSVYYGLWVQQLPYSSKQRKLSKTQVLGLLSSSGSFFQRGYRIRTLLGHTHADDQGFVKLSDRIDRLYLWTWLWMEDSTQLTSERLMTAVNDVIGRVDLTKMTLEDQFLVRNSLGWLGLVDPSFLEKIRPIQKKVVSVSGAGYALYDMEWALIQLLSSTVNQQRVIATDTLKYVKQHPLWNSEEVFFSSMVSAVSKRGTVNTPCEKIVREILDRKSKITTKKTHQLRLDLNTFVITDLETDRKMVSQPLAAGLKLLRDKAVVTCDELALAAFGLYQYDSFVHGAKIFNLISRMRSLSQGKIKLRVKSGNVLSEGDWSFLQIVEPSELSAKLRGEMVALNLVPVVAMGENLAKNINIAKLFKAFHAGTGFTRQEAENILETSKSSTTRILDRLCSSGKIQRSGKGKSTIYSLNIQDAKAVL